ncbi:TetR/AcrR family transcriptional regulator [Sphingomonas jatrophae]|uniref:Transcriptional regulator, TetR family n=1 Tax=Sphingomonas jatrophae TaxID=1166337 RepID=A0A1I6KFT4_9SPHN|nr:TetR family transcriptional regulator C-terminal domain-containing protein [Sphingomonas jatrophae]SFR89750.1 transcriptional regulator, TetR family [Sphingomonas jatrophae]
MPKIVDHEEQRRLIAAAAVQWIAAHGVETLSQRNVAQLAGRSKGNVQHYFPDKASLMFGALRQVSDQREGRERSVPEGGDDPLGAITRRLHAVLPTDAERADEWRVRLSLYVYAARDSEMQTYLANHAREVLERGVADLSAAQARGDVRADVDPRVTYRRLSAAISGIAVAALANGGALSPGEQREMLDEVLRSIRPQAPPAAT